MDIQEYIMKAAAFECTQEGSLLPNSEVLIWLYVEKRALSAQKMLSSYFGSSANLSKSVPRNLAELHLSVRSVDASATSINPNLECILVMNATE